MIRAIVTLSTQPFHIKPVSLVIAFVMVCFYLSDFATGFARVRFIQFAELNGSKNRLMSGRSNRVVFGFSTLVAHADQALLPDSDIRFLVFRFAAMKFIMCLATAALTGFALRS